MLLLLPVHRWFALFSGIGSWLLLLLVSWIGSWQILLILWLISWILLVKVWLGPLLFWTLLLFLALSEIIFSFSHYLLLLCCFRFVQVTHLVLINIKFDFHGLWTWFCTYTVARVFGYLTLTSLMHNCRLNLILVLVLVHLPGHLPGHINRLLWILIDCSDRRRYVDHRHLCLIHANISNIHVNINGILLLWILGTSLSRIPSMCWIIGHLGWLLLTVHLQRSLGSTSWPRFLFLYHFLLCFSSIEI